MNDWRARLKDLAVAVAGAAIAALLAYFGQFPGIPPRPAPPPQPAPPPAPAPIPPPQPPVVMADPPNAIVRLSFNGVGCTATVIGPRRIDGKWWLLTAAHCCNNTGQKGTVRFLSGKTMGVTVANFDRRSDSAWLLTDSNSDVVPFAYLADEVPPPGSPVWHKGFGVDQPGNLEEGTFTSGPDSNGQLRFRLSVSSGDSGGGIVATADGKILSAVCCTSARGARADVWGTSPQAARRIQTVQFVADEWIPLEIPIRMPQKD